MERLSGELHARREESANVGVRLESLWGRHFTPHTEIPGGGRGCSSIKPLVRIPEFKHHRLPRMVRIAVLITAS